MWEMKYRALEKEAGHYRTMKYIIDEQFARRFIRASKQAGKNGIDVTHDYFVTSKPDEQANPERVSRLTVIKDNVTGKSRYFSEVPTPRNNSPSIYSENSAGIGLNGYNGIMDALRTTRDLNGNKECREGHIGKTRYPISYVTADAQGNNQAIAGYLDSIKVYPDGFKGELKVIFLLEMHFADECARELFRGENKPKEVLRKVNNPALSNINIALEPKYAYEIWEESYEKGRIQQERAKHAKAAQKAAVNNTAGERRL